MKKAFAIGMASLCALGVAGGVSALQMSGNTESIQAEYDVSSAFTVTIPAGINFSSANTSINETVSASDLLINDGEILNVSMKSTNGQLQNTSASYIPYSFKIGETTTAIAAATDYELLSIDSGNKTGSSVAITFIAGSLDNVTLAGMHSDTLTFKVEVTFPLMQDIANLKSSIVEGKQYSLKDSRDGKVYSVAKIGSTIWMTKNLNYTDNEDASTWNDGILVQNNEAYYTWDVAMASCPDGWELPNQSQATVIANSNTPTSIVGAPFYGTRAGGVSGGSVIGAGSDNYYWTQTIKADSGNAYDLVYDTGVIMIGNAGKTLGFSARCVAK